MSEPSVARAGERSPPSRAYSDEPRCRRSLDCVATPGRQTRSADADQKRTDRAWRSYRWPKAPTLSAEPPNGAAELGTAAVLCRVRPRAGGVGRGHASRGSVVLDTLGTWGGPPPGGPAYDHTDGALRRRGGIARVVRIAAPAAAQVSRRRPRRGRGSVWCRPGRGGLGRVRPGN